MVRTKENRRIQALEHTRWLWGQVNSSPLLVLSEGGRPEGLLHAAKQMFHLILSLFLVAFTLSEVEGQDSVKVEGLGSAINSEFADYHPLISADESVLFFTSRRENTTGGGKDPDFDIYYEDIYVSHKKDSVWALAINPGYPLNTTGHDAALGLSPDGQRLFIYRDGDIYESKLEGPDWLEPVKLNKNVNSKHRETSACYSFDGVTMYFVSDRPGGFGGTDIYVSEIGGDGKWGEAVNLGSQVNTGQNEDAVFMHPDGKTLYFSSQGHNNTGGYDIFKSVQQDNYVPRETKDGEPALSSLVTGTVEAAEGPAQSAAEGWSTPENLGAPINTTGDDVFFVLAANGKRGYYSSSKPGGSGEKDIYVITYLKKTNKPELTLVKGRITDENKNPIEADIEVTDSKTNEIIARAKS
ncbi:MAG: PD40 domain-containing protein, partial [Flavobacteriales bacterium]|nr:PD40 domain-containing protein [Flavobacteriales bacterium]